MNDEGMRLLLAGIIAALSAGLIYGLDQIVIGYNLDWWLPIVIGIIFALVIVYGYFLVIWWSED